MTQSDNTPQGKDVAEQLGVIKDDLAQLASMVGRIASEQARTASQAARQTAANVAEDAKIKASAFRESAGDTYTKTEASVRKNPALAIGVAVGIGFAAARFLVRRRF